ncbi:hypothetical protein NADFUDRAFT_81739 [Nadsonia fulvescens var. elongata DSM 6958]|uniref:Uncharacterized protein n=1 Tax=Nadsonia fulvescens var. elongata DSM 6958 TaxID=857566 RepID=A0A1E3PPK3_9ASCO|nr:hypothetical protein NADFUDRAFT_81739 [Nadsonia fulvescens var. elongata DSM 6958]
MALTDSSPLALCSFCDQSLLIPNPQLDSDRDSDSDCGSDCGSDHDSHSHSDSNNENLPTHVLDDVLYPCSHHFHWACILKHEFPTRDAIMFCPQCAKSVINPSGQLLCQVTSEGGKSPDFDLAPALLEEFDYRTNPAKKFELALCDACFIGDQMEVFQLVTGTGLEPSDELEEDSQEYQEKKKYIPVNINAPDLEKGWTALFYAAVAGQSDIVRFLLQHGADINAMDFFGRRAVDYAVEEKQQSIVELLSNYNSGSGSA